MKEARFTCFFKQASPEALKEVWSKALNKADFKEKTTLSGLELTLENDQIDLYLYNTGTPSDLGIDYLAEGEYFGDLSAMLSFFQELGTVCADHSMVYEFELYEEDEEGDQLGDSTTLRHAGF